MAEHWVCNSMGQKESFKSHVDRLYDEHKYVTFEWRIGRQRSLDQNALFHVWATEYAAHLLGKEKKEVTEAEVEGMKLTLKRYCFNETKEKFLVHQVKNMFGEEKKIDFRSSKNYRKKEMFFFMCWIQSHALMNHDLVLESTGEFEKLQQSA